MLLHKHIASHPTAGASDKRPTASINPLIFHDPRLPGRDRPEQLTYGLARLLRPASHASTLHTHNQHPDFRHSRGPTSFNVIFKSGTEFPWLQLQRHARSSMMDNQKSPFSSGVPLFRFRSRARARDSAHMGDPHRNCGTEELNNVCGFIFSALRQYACCSAPNPEFRWNSRKSRYSSSVTWGRGGRNEQLVDRHVHSSVRVGAATPARRWSAIGQELTAFPDQPIRASRALTRRSAAGRRAAPAPRPARAAQPRPPDKGSINRNAAAAA